MFSCKNSFRFSVSVNFVVVMVFACCRRRILRIFAFIGVACVIFLCFQVFLVGFLDHDAHLGLRRGARPKFGLDDDELRLIDVSGGRTRTTQYPLQLQQKLKSECSSHNCSVAANLVVSTLRAISQSQIRLTTVRSSNQSSSHNTHVKLSRFKNVWDLLEQKFARPVILAKNIGLSEAHSTRGVNIRWQYLYEADEHMQFTCILSQVNDDYCDCLDSSDEPGTSACSDGRFYCTFQQSDNPLWLTSGRVNDGICDCCDGSDEWQKIQLPEHIAVHDGLAHYGIYQSPCTDHCQELRQQEEQLVSMRLRGLALRQDYLKAGFDNGNDEERYGPSAVFYKLSTACVETSAGKYTYSVCPFGPVKQTEHGRLSVVIGSQAQWLDRGPSVYRLLLGDGDSTNCPDNQPRETTVTFECGDADRVMSVSENELCKYIIKFMTPAAC